jgi:hypothetical protein
MVLDFNVTDIDSSLIKRINYTWSEEKKWTVNHAGFLLVKFASGQSYIYEDVPFSVVSQVISSEDSVGRLFTSLIKNGGYRYYKID